MNIKAIIASSLLTAVFTGTSAIAGDNDRFASADYSTSTESVVIQKVSLNSVVVESVVTVESGRK